MGPECLLRDHDLRKDMRAEQDSVGVRLARSCLSNELTEAQGLRAESAVWKVLATWPAGQLLWITIALLSLTVEQEAWSDWKGKDCKVGKGKQRETKAARRQLSPNTTGQHPHQPLSKSDVHFQCHLLKVIITKEKDKRMKIKNIKVVWRTYPKF